MLRQAELPFAPDRPAEGETSRTIALDDRIVPYVLRRARRRTVGLSIDQRGLRVGAPHRTPLADVENLIRRHAGWVTQKLDEWRERRRAAPLPLADGLRLPYLGGWLRVRLGHGRGQAFWTDGDAPTLTLLPRSPDQADVLLARALRDRALAVLGERLARQAARFGVAAPRLALSSARTRWGSCSLKSGIRLNWRLIHCEPDLIDYVIVHELAHLREMNHGARFWAIVGQYFPDYRNARDALRKLSGSLPVIGKC
ncbi:MAG: M48 family metallopeptidase [Candidatus Accumulibacter sp.]|jgi:predicted metal-dependent hydrolase|nr:M48 family metallopeptidase [Accumulibacter sp.]